MGKMKNQQSLFKTKLYILTQVDGEEVLYRKKYYELNTLIKNQLLKRRYTKLFLLLFMNPPFFNCFVKFSVIYFTIRN